VMEQATSAACKLWKQLKLLHQLVAVLALSKRKQESDCIELPRLEYDNGNSIRIETADIISLLHEMDYTAVRCQGTRDSVQARKCIGASIFSAQKFIARIKYLLFILYMYGLLFSALVLVSVSYVPEFCLKLWVHSWVTDRSK